LAGRTTVKVAPCPGSLSNSRRYDEHIYRLKKKGKTFVLENCDESYLNVAHGQKMSREKRKETAL
jgi:hypothetical protein